MVLGQLPNNPNRHENEQLIQKCNSLVYSVSKKSEKILAIVIRNYNKIPDILTIN